MTSNGMQPDSDGNRPVIGKAAVEIIVSLCLIGIAAVLGWDSWRTGNKWAADGPQAGYFPFYLSEIGRAHV